jgi:hypothetical protein
MSVLSVNPPYPIFSETDGQPLENGYIWIGTVNLDPQTNPISVYWDLEKTIPASQPIRTLGGYPVYNGTPARLYVGVDYSIRVMDKNGSLVYSSLNDNAFDGVSFASNATGDGVQTIFSVSSIPNAIYINGVSKSKHIYSFKWISYIFRSATIHFCY